MGTKTDKVNGKTEKLKRELAEGIENMNQEMLSEPERLEFLKVVNSLVDRVIENSNYEKNHISKQ